MKVYADTGIAWGEAPSPRSPTYAAETVLSTLHVLGDCMVPAVLGQKIASSDDLDAILDRFSGNNYSKGALHSALHHLLAAEQGVSLSKMLGGTRTEVECVQILGTETGLDD